MEGGFQRENFDDIRPCCRFLLFPQKKKKGEELFENESIFFLCTSFLNLNDFFFRVSTLLLKSYEDDGDCSYLQCKVNVMLILIRKIFFVPISFGLF